MKDNQDKKKIAVLHVDVYEDETVNLRFVVEQEHEEQAANLLLSMNTGLLASACLQSISDKATSKLKKKALQKLIAHYEDLLNKLENVKKQMSGEDSLVVSPSDVFKGIVKRKRVK